MKNVKQWVDGLPIKVKTIVATTFVVLLIAVLVGRAVINNNIKKSEKLLADKELIISQKDGEIRALLAQVEIRTKANADLKKENDKKDVLLAASDRSKELIRQKYLAELQAHKKLSAEEQYQLFLTNTGAKDFVGTRYDSNYMAPMESIVNTNNVYSERNMLISANKTLLFDVSQYKAKINNLNTEVANGEQSLEDVRSALFISDSKGADYQAQIDVLKKEVKQVKRRCKITVGGVILLLLGALAI